MSVAVDKRPGKSSLAQTHGAPATASTPGKQTLTEQLPPAPATSAPAAAGAGAAATYTVQAGETLPGIAAKLRTSVDALKAANLAQLKTFPTQSGGVVQGFNQGAVLTVPGAAATPAATAPAPATASPAPPAPTPPAPTTPAATTPAPTTPATTTPAATTPAATTPAATTPATTTPAATTPAATTPAATTPAATTPAPTTPAATTPAPAGTPAAAAPESSGGLVDSLVGMMTGAWEYLTGSSSTPAADPTTAPTTSAPSTSPDAPAAAEPAAPAAPTAPAAPPPMADGTDAQRGERLSTFSPDELPAKRTARPDAAAASAAKRGQWLSTEDVTTAGTGKSGEEFVAAIDEMNAGAKFTADQNQMIAAAKDFAAAPKALTPAQEAKAVMDWSGAKLTLDGITLDPELKTRVTRFVRFAAWAGLVTGPTPVGSVMRSPAEAHLWSTAWMFNVATNTKSANTLHTAKNRQQLVKNVTARGGSDTDGNAWLSPTTVEGLKSRKDDDADLYEYIKTTAVADAAKVKTFPNQAAEGYTTPEKRHPNVFPGDKVSKHLSGGAVDMSPPWVFGNMYDPLIDAMAAYFGLSRPLKDSSNPEHWHFERLGTPPTPEEEAH